MPRWPALVQSPFRVLSFLHLLCLGEGRVYEDLIGQRTTLAFLWRAGTRLLNDIRSSRAPKFRSHQAFTTMNGEGPSQAPSPGPSQGLDEDPSQGVSPLLQVYLKLKLGREPTLLPANTLVTRTTARGHQRLGLNSRWAPR
ncbi:hypothetical protein Pcinc_034076 [Petrolisthes cinctipes]|uniref:Uncharacterized protein n=1 Tax=Petrolisthes cinctipes TaxID=88211 RepID=A0AAE1JXF1_PETCI|nr:hypothetical protein Pcinc_034076 [Petrolisthes cinctipes]